MRLETGQGSCWSDGAAENACVRCPSPPEVLPSSQWWMLLPFHIQKTTKLAAYEWHNDYSISYRKPAFSDFAAPLQKFLWRPITVVQHCYNSGNLKKIYSIRLRPLASSAAPKLSSQSLGNLPSDWLDGK